VGVRRLIEALPGDLTLTLVDVGSAGGLDPRWAPFAPILSSVLFDPREPAASGSFGRGATRVYPVALGAKAGSEQLYLTQLANMSSFLKPDPDAFAPYGRKQGDATVVGSEPVPIDTLDALAKADGFSPDLIKVDTQGSELQVLAGAEACLKSILFAEVEVSFFTRYTGQPLLADVQAFMNMRGFDLIDLLHIKRYRAANSAGIRNTAARPHDRSGRAAYANAIFLRREADLLASDDHHRLLKAIVALTAYGKADLAARLFDQGNDKMPPATRDRVEAALASLRLSGPAAGLAWLKSRLAG
jgi:FkbM family methyltransferase